MEKMKIEMEIEVKKNPTGKAKLVWSLPYIIWQDV